MGRCNKCRFAEVEAGQDGKPLLWCHRGPPQSLLIGDNVHTTHRPISPLGWCGEFKRSWKRLFSGHVAP